MLYVPGLLLEGELPHESDFAEYIGKFCFDYDPGGEVVGTIHFELKPWMNEMPVEDRSKEIVFLVFDDEEKHWIHARRNWDSSTCEQKKALASLVTHVQPVNVTTNQPLDYMIRIRLRSGKRISG